METPTGPYRGIAVLGAPRSGTTLLRRLLDAHPSIFCPPETHLLIAAANFIHEDRVDSGPPLGVLAKLWYCGVPTETTIERVRNFTFQFLDEMCTKSGKPTWAEKTGSNGFYIDEIERVFGRHCRFVCIVRHGLDVVLSTKEMCDKLGTYPAPYYPYIHRHQAPLEAFAQAWVDINRRMRKFCEDHPENAVRVRYEDIVADPAQAMTRLSDALAMPANGADLAARAFHDGQQSVGMGDWKTYSTNGVVSTSVGRWRAKATQTVTSRIAEILNPTLEAEGYEPLSASTSANTDTALRDSKRALLLAKFRTTAKRE